MFDASLIQNLQDGAYGPFIVIPVQGMDQGPIIGLMPASAAAQMGLYGQPAAMPQMPADTVARPRRWIPSARTIQWTLFGACGLTAVAAITSGLGVWPVLDAGRWGLDGMHSLCLVAAGVYLLAAIIYASPRTRPTSGSHPAALDVRLMTWGIMAVGLASSVAFGLAVLAIFLVAVLLSALVAWLFKSAVVTN